MPWSQQAWGGGAGIWWRTVLWAEETLPTRACEPPPLPERLGSTTAPTSEVTAREHASSTP